MICCVHCFRSPQKSWPAYCHASVLTPAATPMMYCTSRLASTPLPCCWSPTYLYTLSSPDLAFLTYWLKNWVRSDWLSSWPWNSTMAWRLAVVPAGVTPETLYVCAITSGVTLAGVPASTSESWLRRGGSGRPWTPKTASTCSATSAGSVTSPARMAFWPVDSLCSTWKVVSKSASKSLVVAVISTDVPVGATVKVNPAAVSHSETAATEAGTLVTCLISWTVM
mmetsp:Transcript_47918/g.115198  ORF Transcript_47918/g.115198 Transcript_47918/m.115198 type:complete len:224 (-) Transcript_47918:244-915(-)